jgi:hypothetical protein
VRELTNTVSTPGQIGCKTPSIEDSAGTNYINGLACERGSTSLDKVHHSRNENAGWEFACMSTPFSCLGTDDIHTDIKGLGNMFRVADHVHDEDTRFV